MMKISYFMSKCIRFSPRCWFHYLGVVAEKSRKMTKFDICEKNKNGSLNAAQVNEHRLKGTDVNR